MSDCPVRECGSEDPSRGYIGAIVLGLNDALVELAGALAGFTVSLGNNKIITLAGFTMGIAATLSMASSEYLSKKSSRGFATSLKFAGATGAAYLLVTALMLAPYIILDSPTRALGSTIALAVLIIFCFAWSVGKIQKRDFWKDFLEMLSLSSAVAFLCFAISWGADKLWGIGAA
ncbi:MAG: hypothetical protein HDQ93_01210 [Desulfovibrio sp.]|nr:hypothetical protein [Desulfovibrio sp.]